MKRPLSRPSLLMQLKRKRRGLILDRIKQSKASHHHRSVHCCIRIKNVSTSISLEKPSANDDVIELSDSEPAPEPEAEAEEKVHDVFLIRPGRSLLISFHAGGKVR